MIKVKIKASDDKVTDEDLSVFTDPATPLRIKEKFEKMTAEDIKQIKTSVTVCPADIPCPDINEITENLDELGAKTQLGAMIPIVSMIIFYAFHGVLLSSVWGHLLVIGMILMSFNIQRKMVWYLFNSVLKKWEDAFSFTAITLNYAHSVKVASMLMLKELSKLCGSETMSKFYSRMIQDIEKQQAEDQAVTPKPEAAPVEPEHKSE